MEVTRELLLDMQGVLSDIPDDKWCEGPYYIVRWDGGTEMWNRCAAGHYAKHRYGMDVLPDEVFEYGKPSADFFQEVFHVNDGKSVDYRQETPKARVLAFIEDKLKELGE